VHKVAILHDRIGGKAGGGGGVRELRELALGLRDLGHQPVVLCHDLSRSSDFETSLEGVEVRAVREVSEGEGGGRLELARRYLREMPALAALVPDDVTVVHAQGWPALRAGAIAASRSGAPFVWTRHDEIVFDRAVVPDLAIVSDRNPLRRAARMLVGLPDFRAARRAAAILVLNEPSARMVERAFRRRARILRLPPAGHFFDAPDRAEARARLGIPDGAFLVLGAAILFPHRRFEDLIEAMALLRDEPDVQALIVGSDHADPAYADRLEELVRARGLQDRVRLPRASVSDRELHEAYAAADVFVFPNQRQTWGLAPLEALASGTPVIVSTGAGVHEVLDGRPGVLSVAPERPEAIAAAVRQARTRDLRADVPETRDWIRRELNARRYAERMVEVYDEVTGG
jgi:glycosyltransferase involved in cell wall biosynthesis